MCDHFSFISLHYLQSVHCDSKKPIKYPTIVRRKDNGYPSHKNLLILNVLKNYITRIKQI